MFKKHMVPLTDGGSVAVHKGKQVMPPRTLAARPDANNYAKTTQHFAAGGPPGAPPSAEEAALAAGKARDQMAPVNPETGYPYADPDTGTLETLAEYKKWAEPQQ